MKDYKKALESITKLKELDKQKKETLEQLQVGILIKSLFEKTEGKKFIIINAYHYKKNWMDYRISPKRLEGINIMKYKREDIHMLKDLTYIMNLATKEVKEHKGLDLSFDERVVSVK